MKKYSYDKEQEQKAIEMYKAKAPLKEIGEQIGVSSNTVLRLLNRAGIERDRNVYSPNYTQETQRAFYEKYLRSSYVPFCPTSDYAWCKNECNVDFFDNIDNCDKAYILGLLYADGNVKRNGYTFTITLQERDKLLLEQINEILGNPHELHFAKMNNENWQDCYRLAVHNKHMCDALIYHGCVPNKSLVLEFPHNLKFELYKDFIRGYFDGNGNIGYQGQNASFTSTRNFCEDAKEFIENYLHVNCGIYHANANNVITSILQVGGRRQSSIFLKWIYEGADLFMERKYRKYVDMYESLTV